MILNLVLYRLLFLPKLHLCWDNNYSCWWNSFHPKFLFLKFIFLFFEILCSIFWIDELHTWCKWGKNVSLCFWCLMSLFWSHYNESLYKKEEFLLSSWTVKKSSIPLKTVLWMFLDATIFSKYVACAFSF